MRVGVLFLCLSCFLIHSCRKSYNPPAIGENNHFLAVDGFIQTGNGSSSFIINHSLNLADTIPDIPELNAQVFILGSDGSSYPLQDANATGVYVSDPLNLDSTLSYRLRILSADGNEYLSDFVETKSAPPIDSLSWELINDPLTKAPAVNVYVYAHDPRNQTRYYRWDYLETYKHTAFLETTYGEANGLIYPFPPDSGITNCWTTAHSANILLGTSVALSQDVISHIPIAHYDVNDPRMDYGNSILVRQYPLTQEGYSYWLTVQKNSQSLGGLFDVQPAQITGNIHCVTNPANLVLGFISASSVQERRIYISSLDLPGWKSQTPAPYCPIDLVNQDQANLLIYNFPDTSFAPYRFVGDFVVDLLVAPKLCLDCRRQGGTNIKPAFWPSHD